MFEALKYENSRLLVIECAVLIEENISSTLGIILGFDWKKSKSLGYSSSLSFYNKVHLMQDFLGKDSFEKIKKYLDEEVDDFNRKISELKNFEKKYQWLFFCFTLQLNNDILDSLEPFLYQKGKVEGEKEAIKLMYEKMKELLLSSDDYKHIFDKAIENVNKEINKQ